MNSNTLWKEAGRQLALSLALFAALFALLWIIETLYPQLRGQLLPWSDPAFLVGIPASIIGVAYVFTIRNPKNYTGFYMGIAMSLLLACQFYMQGSIDLPLLYILVFVPFMIRSILLWKRNTLNPPDNTPPLVPEFLDRRRFLITLLTGLAIVVADTCLLFCTDQQPHDVRTWTTLLCSAGMIASSVLANYWLIYQKNDAWICWVLYSFFGLTLNLLLAPVNWFSVALFALFLYVNASAQVAWLRITPNDKYGWLSRH